MIREYSIKDISNILYVINEAATKYKGVVPDNCLHEPYMSEQELIVEFTSGVRMFGFSSDNKLIGVMGIQELKEVTLIRHAYILTNYQRKGVGRKLLKYLLEKNQSTCLLVGTWKAASWAIRFYEKFGFILHTKKQTSLLLKKYWRIPLNQMNHSIVLEK